MHWKYTILALAVVALGAVVGVASLTGRVTTRLRQTWDRLTAPAAGPPAVPRPPRRTWDGLIHLEADQERALGLEVVPVAAQDQPTRLEINGRTDYDEDSLFRIRPRFRSLIDRVHVRLGQAVTQGDPLVDLFSASLAEAKSVYEEKLAQWEHDQRQVARSEPLYQTGAKSEKDYLDDVNKEKQSGLEAKLARDTLLVLGLSPAEVVALKDEDGTRKARMTLRAPGDGIVIRREVVQGNLYDQDDVLLVIAPLDHFWVWGNVYPSDAGRVHIGQAWQILYPSLSRPIAGRVESITSDVAEDTKTIRIRTTIPNLGDRIKADMLVTGTLEIPPAARSTVIPRVAMVATDGDDYVFIRRGDAAADGGQTFERRTIQVAQEGHDSVVVSEGLQPGERVAGRGSLILAQMYEDAAQTRSAP